MVGFVVPGCNLFVIFFHAISYHKNVYLYETGWQLVEKV